MEQLGLEPQRALNLATVLQDGIATGTVVRTESVLPRPTKPGVRHEVVVRNAPSLYPEHAWRKVCTLVSPRHRL